MTTKEFKFSNGDEVKEKITGFQGVITGTTFYLTGCNQYLVTPKCKDIDKPSEGLWYDEGRLDFVKNEINESDVEADDNGCDTPPSIGFRGC